MLRGLHYPHLEQITYSTPDPASPAPCFRTCHARNGWKPCPKMHWGVRVHAPYVDAPLSPMGARAAARRGTRHDDDARRHEARNVAHARPDRAVRLSHLDDELWASLHARPDPDPAVAGE